MAAISNETRLLLEDIERRIDPDTEEDFRRQWEDFLYDRFRGDVFSPCRKRCSPSAVKTDSININDAIEDYDLMLRSELLKVSAALNSKGENAAMRANYGTGIMTSLFGAEIFVMPRENNTLPTTKSFNDTSRMETVINGGIPDLMNGFGKRVFEFGEFVAEILEKYPKIRQYVSVYHPDLQGPLDICELLWGGEMFYAMYDEPELVHAAMSLVTETYTAFLNRWYELFPGNSHINPHWNTLCHRGKIFLRCDSAMNLSPEFYREFSLPYDSLLLERFDGGCMHFCGRGDHYIDILCGAPKMYGINLGQPGHNNMETIFQSSVDKGIKVLGYSAKLYEAVKDRHARFNHSLHVRR